MANLHQLAGRHGVGTSVSVVLCIQCNRSDGVTQWLSMLCTAPCLSKAAAVGPGSYDLFLKQQPDGVACGIHDVPIAAV